jgi:hypothetical protein
MKELRAEHKNSGTADFNDDTDLKAVYESV